MPMQPSDSIIGPRRGSAADALAVARAGGANRLDELERFLTEAYRLAPLVGIDPAIVVVQSALETADWTDRWWSERLNSAGIGITGDPQQNEASMTWRSGADSARGQIVHLWLYTRGKPLPEALVPFAALDPRRDALPASSLGGAPTLAALGGKWSVVPDYGQRIANRARHIFPNLPDQESEAPVGMRSHQFVGLDTKVVLPDDIEVIIDIVPDDKIRWVRSPVKFKGQTRTTFHDTGSPGSTARNQRNYLHGGPMKCVREDANGRCLEQARRLVGFNFAVDDVRIIQLTPLDEETWAAGTDAGNRASYAIEMCFGGNINFDRSLRNAVALHGGLIAARGWQTDTALVRHKDWSGKWCPAQILNRELWPTVLHRVGQAAAAAANGGGGTNGGDTGPFAQPLPVPELVPFRNGDADTIPPLVRAADGTPFFFVGDRVRAVRAMRRAQRGDPASDRIGPDLKAGDEFDVSWIFVSDVDNEPYYLTPFDTRILVKDTERVGDRPQLLPVADPMEPPVPDGQPDFGIAGAGDRAGAAVAVGDDAPAPGH